MQNELHHLSEILKSMTQEETERSNQIFREVISEAERAYLEQFDATKMAVLSAIERCSQRVAIA